MSADNIVVLPIVIPLITAIATLIVRNHGRIQQLLSGVGMAGYIGSVALLAHTVGDAVVAYQLSAWPAPYGITLVADALSVFMLLLTAAVSAGVSVYAMVHIDGLGQQVAYHPLFAFMLVGVSGAFLTADIFNLFVWFEVMLMSSYILVVLYSHAEQTQAALEYIVLNVIGSVVMLLAVGGLYATVGTLNMADLAVRLGDPGTYGIQVAPVLGLSMLLLAVFALKAGIVPFHFWVPRTYSAAPAPVAAMLAGVTKKVGVYAIIRLYFTVFAAASIPAVPALGESALLTFAGVLLFGMAAASVFVGGLGAISRETMDELLAYSSIGQIGFIMLPLAFAALFPGIRALGIAAALVYTVNHALAKSMLFLVSGVLYRSTGSTRFTDLGGLAGERPVLAAAFFIGALSLIGMPPALGFFGKFLVFATLAEQVAFLALAVAITGSVFTILYVSRAWNQTFWGDPVTTETLPVSPVKIGVVAAFAAVIVGAGVGIDVVITHAQTAAETVISTESYIDAVLGGEAQ
jgi:multicomponent Na+:H+ antiporter subunit D